MSFSLFSSQTKNLQLIYSVSHSFIQQILIEHLLCAGNSLIDQGYINDKKTRIPAQVVGNSSEQSELVTYNVSGSDSCSGES